MYNEALVCDVRRVFDQMPLASLRHLRANQHRLIRRQYTDGKGGGCPMYLLSECLERRIASKADLQAYFGADEEDYAAPRDFVRAWDGVPRVPRYNGCQLSRELLLMLLEEAISERTSIEASGGEAEERITPQHLAGMPG